MGYRPHTRRIIVAAPSGQVVGLLDMKQHLRLASEEYEYDDEIVAAEAAAVSTVETATQRLLLRRQVTLLLPGLPAGRGAIELPGGEVAQVSSVTVDGVQITGCTVHGSSPALLLPAAEWPVVQGEGFPVSIVYTAGYATVPRPLVAAIKLIAEDLFYRPEIVPSVGASSLSVRAQAMLAPFRILPA